MTQAMHDGFPVAGRSKVVIRAAALNARKVLGIAPGKIDITLLLDRLSAEYGVDYDVVEEGSDLLPRGVEACWLPEDRTLFIRASIYDEMRKGGQRAVFTLGHELGHIVLAHRRTMNRFVGQLKPYNNSEWQANRFGAEFTMPIDVIQREGLFTPELLVSRFGVSGVAARIRIDELSADGLLRKKP